jgi:hypothetical protein
VEEAVYARLATEVAAGVLAKYFEETDGVRQPADGRDSLIRRCSRYSVRNAG